MLPRNPSKLKALREFRKGQGFCGAEIFRAIGDQTIPRIFRNIPANKLNDHSQILGGFGLHASGSIAAMPPSNCDQNHRIRFETVNQKCRKL